MAADDPCSHPDVAAHGSLGPVQAGQEYLSIAELAQRWRCSRGTVYNRLRAVGAQVLDFAPRGKRGRKAVHIKTIIKIEHSKTKRLL
jgi:hypothetical protein